MIRSILVCPAGIILVILATQCYLGSCDSSDITNHLSSNWMDPLSWLQRRQNKRERNPSVCKWDLLHPDESDKPDNLIDVIKSVKADFSPRGGGGSQVVPVVSRVVVEHGQPRNDREKPPDNATVAGPSIDSSKKTLPHSPVVYRYYGRSRSRTSDFGSIPFILLGPNVDHWKVVGQKLAGQGFSAMACEREFQDSIGWSESAIEGRNLVQNILKGARWNKVVIVGCDREALLAIQAANQLGPEKVAGLVLCGDLRGVAALILESHPHLKKEGTFALESFLEEHLDCPFALSWDGEKPKSNAENLSSNRWFILGGGVAPHRQRPELFSWLLTRFVEEKVENPLDPSKCDSDVDNSQHEQNANQGNKFPFQSVNKLMPSGSFLVYGRIIATTLFYASAMKAGLYQYVQLRSGVKDISLRFRSLSFLMEKVMGCIPSFAFLFAVFRRNDDNGQGFEEGVGRDELEDVTPEENYEEREEKKEKNMDRDKEREHSFPGFLIDQVVT